MKTWTHNNLEWLYDLDLQVTWEESQDIPDGYRLATVKEICSVLDYTKHNPAVIDECPFGWNDSWTSEIYVDSGAHIFWTVNLITGAVQPKDRLNKRDTLYVRNV